MAKVVDCCGTMAGNKSDLQPSRSRASLSATAAIFVMIFTEAIAGEFFLRLFSFQPHFMLSRVLLALDNSIVLLLSSDVLFAVCTCGSKAVLFPFLFICLHSCLFGKVVCDVCTPCGKCWPSNCSDL